jgi:hypothetical protein
MQVFDEARDGEMWLASSLIYGRAADDVGVGLAPTFDMRPFRVVGWTRAALETTTGGLLVE